MSLLSLYAGYAIGRAISAEIAKKLMLNLTYLLVKRDKLLSEEQMKSAILDSVKLFLEKKNPDNDA
jgi:hypothetical protein